MGTCKWTGGTCWYSHCLEYVAPSKKKVKALAKRRTTVGKDTDVEVVFQKLKTLNEKGEYESDGLFCIRRRGGSEVSDSFGFTSGDIELLMEQGIKPWEFEEASVSSTVYSIWQMLTPGSPHSAPSLSFATIDLHCHTLHATFPSTAP